MWIVCRLGLGQNRAGGRRTRGCRPLPQGRNAQRWGPEDGETSTKGDWLVGFAVQTDLCWCVRVGRGELPQSFEVAVCSWRSCCWANGTQTAVGRQVFLEDEVPLPALWTHGDVLAGQPSEELLPGFRALGDGSVVGVGGLDTEQAPCTWG